MKAFITGCSGQDGSHLTDLLLEKGYEVHGTVRRPLCETFENLSLCRDKITLHQADMMDGARMANLLREIQPDEVYNLAAMTFVPSSWEQPLATAESTGLAVAKLLDAILQYCPKARFYQASSSEMYGNAPAPQNEETPMHPVSPYGVAKLYAHRLVATYRERYGMFACAGICFNHEGPRRGRHFVTRKVCDAVARIKLGKQESLVHGNLSAARDWGYAPDYVLAMWMMLQTEKPTDYVIATGEYHSVLQLVEEAFENADLTPWDYLRFDETLVRQNEIDMLCGNSENIRKSLGWEPTTSFEKMIQIMFQSALEREA